MRARASRRADRKPVTANGIAHAGSTDKQYITTNHIVLPVLQVSSLTSNDIFNTDDQRPMGLYVLTTIHGYLHHQRSLICLNGKTTKKRKQKQIQTIHLPNFYDCLDCIQKHIQNCRLFTEPIPSKICS